MATVSTAEYNATPDAVADLTAQLGEAAGAAVVDTDIDEAEPTGLIEKADDQVVDKTPQSDPLYAVTVTRFDEESLALGPLLLKGLHEMNFVRPSKIQAASLPKIWAGRSLLAQSHNGTGKTACFVLGMLKAVSPQPKSTQALCLCPTRELALQIYKEILKMGKYLIAETDVRVKAILREERYERGDCLEEQIVVGTPGKVFTLVKMGVIECSSVKIFVLDEADEMLQLGGLGDQTKRIRQKLPKQVQTLFFSATWTDSIKKFARMLAAMSDNDWSQIEVKREMIFNDQVRQVYYRTQGVAEKTARLAEILNTVTVGQCIIFAHTRDAVERLKEVLIENGHSVSALHGRMEEASRDKVLVDFHAGNSRFLVTTNVLSRGIDVPSVTLVIQFDMPVGRGGVFDPETYLHRVGRTGRFGRPGVALALISDEKEMQVLKKIETYFDRAGLIKEVPHDTESEEFERILTAQ